MSNFQGMGVMIRALSGGSEHSPEEYYGRVIREAELIDTDNHEGVFDKPNVGEATNILILKFHDETKIAIFDAGQS